MRSRSAIAFVVSFAFVILTGCVSFWPDDRVPRDRIFSYVNDHIGSLEAFPYDLIEQIHASDDSAETMNEKESNVIKKYLGQDTIVKSAYAYNENIMRFYCGGSGFVGGSTYTGFYLSKDDTPFTLEFVDCPLTEIEPGVFEWQNEDASEKFHTEKIRDNWYYYVMDWY